MSHLSDEFLQLCTRVLSGEGSAEERRQLDEHLQDPACRAYYAKLRAQWRHWTPPPAPAFDTRRAYERLVKKLDRPGAVAGEMLPFPRPRPRRPWLRVAAAAVAMAAAAVVLFSIHSNPPAPGPATPAAATAWQSRTVAGGDKTTIALADGSHVTLNGQSTLAWPETFGATRTVRLQGEAYFEVAHDAAHPFVVEAGGLRTTVLGTKFNLSAGARAATAEVALVEGRVQVEAIAPRTPLAATVLQPGQQFTLEKKSGAARVSAFDRDSVTGWLTGRLVFRDDRLDVVAAKLERRFGVTCEIADPAVASKAINAHFETESLPEILEALSFAGGIRCETVPENGAIARVKFSPAAANHTP